MGTERTIANWGAPLETLEEIDREIEKIAKFAIHSDDFWHRAGYVDGKCKICETFNIGHRYRH